MTLSRMTVTNEYGQIATYTRDDVMEQDLKGTYGYCYQTEEVRDPYSFWARVNVNVISGDVDTYYRGLSYAEKALFWPSQVRMVMPMGGAYSGLYRYPRIGETVLVAYDSTGYYMMGYVPTADTPFGFKTEGEAAAGTEGADLSSIFSEEAALFRYGNTTNTRIGGKKEPYSEIGFRKEEKAQWPQTAGEEDYPPIDRITISSAGNIRKTAENHHLQKAKRMEILVDLPEVADRKTGAVDDAGTPALGDNPGDDVGLHGGDLHIRAANRVVIKAGQELQLQVGRTTVRIDDQGFNVTTKMVTGNYPNSYDTELNLHPREGISLTGKNINLNAGYRFNIGDMLGGQVMGTLGVVSIEGREVNLDTTNRSEYMTMTALNALEYVVNSTMTGMALTDAKKDRAETASYIQYGQENLAALIQAVKKTFSLYGQRKSIRQQRLEEEDAARRAPWIAEMERVRERQEAGLGLQDEYEEQRAQLRAKRRTPQPWTQELTEEIAALEAGMAQMEKRLIYTNYEMQALDKLKEAMLLQKDKDGNDYAEPRFDPEERLNEVDKVLGPMMEDYNRTMAKYWETRNAILDAEDAGDTDLADSLRAQRDELAVKIKEDGRRAYGKGQELMRMRFLSAAQAEELFPIPWSTVQDEQDRVQAAEALARSRTSDVAAAQYQLDLARQALSVAEARLLSNSSINSHDKEYWNNGEGAMRRERYYESFDDSARHNREIVPSSDEELLFYRTWLARRAYDEADGHYRATAGIAPDPAPVFEDPPVVPGGAGGAPPAPPGGGDPPAGGGGSAPPVAPVGGGGDGD
jgi:hypothetical protein